MGWIPMAMPRTQVTVAPRTGWAFSCTRTDGSPEDCGFMVRDHDPRQLVQIVQLHAAETHGFTYPEKDILTNATPVQW